MSGFVQVQGVSKSFGAVGVLRGIDLEVPSGQLAAVLGPSGCGKTTLLRVIAGLARADTGTVVVDGHVVADATIHVAPEQRRIGLVPQEGALFPHLDVAHNIAFGLARSERRHAHHATRVHEMAELVGLGDLLRRLPHQLSGGQQQRVALARCLAPGPDVVLLDEPFAALDAALRQEVRSEVQAVLASTGTTAVLVTHDQDEALSMANLVAVLRGGVVVQAGAPRLLYEAPADLELARFLGDAVVLRGQLDHTARSVRCVLGDVPVVIETDQTAREVQLLLRPEQVVLDASVSATAATTGIVEAVTYYGRETLVNVRLRDGSVVRSRVAGSAGFSGGDEVGVRSCGRGRVYPITR